MLSLDKIKSATQGFLQRYGKLGLAVYMSVSAVSIGSCYLAVRNGVDSKKLLKRFGFDVSDSQERAGTLLGAYAIHKLLLPARVAATAFIMGMVTKWRKPPPKVKL